MFKHLGRHRGGVTAQLHFTDTQSGTTEKRYVPSFKCNRKQLIVASARQFRPEAYSSQNIWNSLRNMVDAFYRFSRPHTIIGTALSIVSVSLLAVEKSSDFSPILFIGMIQAIVPALMMNIYIVGLNQIYNIEIDKVNKPYLPLASGEYSVENGVFIVTSFAILSFWVSSIVGSWPLFWALLIWLCAWYSIFNKRELVSTESDSFQPDPVELLRLVVPPRIETNILPMFRWKRFALAAALCIVTVRAVIVQIAFFLHMQTHVLAKPALLSRPVIFATAFMCFFSGVIALFKVVGHVALTAILWSRAKTTDLSSKTEITSFYMFIWKLFYAEYFLIPLVR